MAFLTLLFRPFPIKHVERACRVLLRVIIDDRIRAPSGPNGTGRMFRTRGKFIGGGPAALHCRGPERSHPSLHMLRRSLCSAGAAATDGRDKILQDPKKCRAVTSTIPYNGAVMAARARSPREAAARLAHASARARRLAEPRWPRDLREPGARARHSDTQLATRERSDRPVRLLHGTSVIAHARRCVMQPSPISVQVRSLGDRGLGHVLARALLLGLPRLELV